MPTTPSAPPAPSDAPDGNPEGERVLEGLPVSPGIAIGPVYAYAREREGVERRNLNAQEIDKELDRFRQALQKAARDLDKIGQIAREKLGDEHARIFEAQADMLEDPTLKAPVLEAIRAEHLSADYAVHRTLSAQRELLAASPSEYFRDRAADLLDLEDRILRHLRSGKILSAVDEDSIVTAGTLTAADVVLFARRGIRGLALTYGGATSHVSIMARAFALPAAIGVPGLDRLARHGDTVIIDGNRGTVIVRPTPETLAFYRQRQQRHRALVRAQRKLVPLAPETRDGHRVTLRANLEFEEELDLLARFGAEGIGLFRSEILVLMRRRVQISEAEQYAIYRRIAERAGPGGTTFRVLDLGGDKMLPIAHREANPFLGWRGLRVLLDKPDLLVPQLRAILRASAHGPTRIMLPMVTDVSEVEAFRQTFEATRDQLRRDGHAFDEHVPVGIMVEVPGTALLAERFAPLVDFFSIGSNDLTQYTLAVDRGNDLVARLFDELHPGVLMLIRQTINAGHRYGRSVSLCGELAGQPLATPVLLGLGLDEFSLSPVYLPDVKQVIRGIDYEAAQKLAAECLLAPDAATVRRLALDFLRGYDGMPMERLAGA